MTDPKIRYDIETGITGEQDAEKLAQTLTRLGETLEGNLKREAEAAAKALEMLGARKREIDNFRQLTNESGALAIEVAEATAAVNRLSAELPAAAANTAKLAAAEEQARTAVAGTKALLDEQRQALSRLREEYTGAARRTDEYRDASAQLKTTIGSLRQDYRDQQAALKDAAAQAAAAATAEQKLAAEFNAAATSATRARAAVQDNTAALDRSRTALSNAGIQTNNLAQSERMLEDAIGRVRKEVTDLAPAFARTATASATSVRAQITDQERLQQSMQQVQSQLQKIQSIAMLAVGGGIFGGMIKDVAGVGDGMKNLQARIGLVTGEGEAFAKSWASVQDIALRTNTALESTGTLFARIAEAGKSAGLTSEEAQKRALSLTETINQAVQLSGSSAQASDAAITQLIQGLQSGVLRGEEFNSVMEQAPRLAKALADGLSVTTGELRKMAGEGKLTAEVVMGALRGQAATVEAEFGKLPATVGRALQNLETRWAQYVAANDNGLVSTENAAKLINGLARNLDVLVGSLTMAGKAWAAIKVASLAADLYKAAIASANATTATQANTVATTANTAAHVSNAAAVRGSAAAQTASATAATANAAKVGGAVTGLVSGVVKFNAALAILVNADVIGKWLGETAAKWMGYGKALEEAEKAQAREAAIAAGRAEQMANMTRLLDENAKRLKDARDRSFELSEASIKVVAEFDKLVEKGKSASEAVAAIGKDFDLNSVAGFRDAGAVLDRLLADGKITAEQFRAAWSQALDGKDLGVFEATARAAFAGSAREAERMAAVLDSTAREAIRRTGLDFSEISGGMSAASRSAINDTDIIIAGLDRLGQQGVDVGRVVSESLSKGIDTATTEKALEAVRGQIEQVRSRLGETVANGLLDQAAQKAQQLGAALEGAKPGINSVAEAMRNLGITTDKALSDAADKAKRNYDVMKESGQASARELAQGFKAAAEAAITASNGVVPEWVKSEAAARGYKVMADEAGKATIKAGDGSALGGLVAGWNSASNAASDYRRILDDVAAATAKQNALGVMPNAASDAIQSTLKSGEIRTAGNDLGTLTGIAAYLKAAGVDDDARAREIAREFADAHGNVIWENNPGQMKYGGDGSTLSYALNKAAESYTFGTGPGAKTIPKEESSRTVNVNIALGGRPLGTVPTNPQGAAVLEDLLRQLEQAQSTSALR